MAGPGGGSVGMDYGTGVPDSVPQEGGAGPHAPTPPAATGNNGHADTAPAAPTVPFGVNEERRQLDRRTMDRDAAVLRRAFEGFSDGILVCDGTDKVIFSNQPLHALFPGSPGAGAIQGWSFEEIVRVALRRRIIAAGSGFPDPEAHVAWRMTQRRALSGRRVQEISINDRWYRRVEERIPEAADGGLPGGAIITTYSDITDLKQAQTALEAAIAERGRQVEETAAARAAAEAALLELRSAQDTLVQTEKLASLGSMVAGIAHELNTPVGISYTAASHLRAELSKFRALVDGNRVRKADLDEFLELVGEAANLLEVNSGRASRLVQSFKNVSADQASDQRRAFELKPYLDEIVMSVGPRWKQGGHAVHLHCPDGIVLDSYPGALSQVLTNLIVNSTVHGFGEDRRGRIDISVVRPLAGEVVLVYRDDGRGIPLADLSRIFDPFFTTRRGQGSTGLGLNIVYNLVTRTLQGRIDVWSAPGQGARFTLRLPRAVKEEG